MIDLDIREATAKLRAEGRPDEVREALLAEVDRLRAALGRAVAALVGHEPVMAMAAHYAEAGGSRGPEMREYLAVCLAFGRGRGAVISRGLEPTA